jgi:hypothetical protein
MSILKLMVYGLAAYGSYKLYEEGKSRVNGLRSVDPDPTPAPFVNRAKDGENNPPPSSSSTPDI